MSPEQVFLHRYGQIERMVQGASVADLLDLSNALRQLLADEAPLVDTVNRKHRLRLRFVANPSTIDTIARWEASGIPTDVMLWEGDVVENQRSTVELSKQEFLKHPVLFTDGRHITAGQIIKACANRFGGVHFSAADTDGVDESLMRSLNNTFFVGGAPSVFRQLLALGKITHQAVKPLASAVRAGA